MPGHSSKKQSQRTKGNLRPSSSSHAAELLTSAGTASTGFIGFGSAPKYVPASSALDDMDTSLDSDFRLVLRKLTKRDATTKIKGLQEFGELCKEKSEEDLKGVLPFWPRTYNKMALDIDYRVREAAQQAMSTLVSRVRRNLAPYLRNLMGAWVLSQCDTYPTVASSAQGAFQDAFPPVKQTEALVFCKESVLEYLTENLITHTQQTLSDPKSTEPEDMENKYNRVLTSSLLAVRKLLSSLPANEIESLKQPITTLLDSAKFWKHGKSKINMVKGAMYYMLAGLCQMLPELANSYASKISPLVLHNLDDNDAAIVPYLWEATLSVINCIQECWKHVNVQKAFWPKLRKVLETGCHGNAVVIATNLLPLISKIPADLFPDNDKFYDEFFTCFKLGLSLRSVQKSTSECSAMVRSYMECAHYIIIQNTGKTLSSCILLDQVMPVVEASLLEKDSTLYKSPLYTMLGQLLNAVENADNSAMKQASLKFWTHLKNSLEVKLTSTEELEKGDNFDERIVFLVKCLFYPQTEVKQKVGKVKFQVISETDTRSKIPKVEVSAGTKVELAEHASNFVQDLILTAFELAHKHFSASHLRIFAQLLEFDSSDKVVAKVIACCHGDVETETTSHYFVFEICIPWIQKLQETGEIGPEFTHLVHVVCIFLSVLDEESVKLLLDNMSKTCKDLKSQYILLEKLFGLAGSNPSVLTWLQGEQFGEQLLSHSRAVCDREIDDSWKEETTSILNILSLVLATRVGNNKLLVPRKYVDGLLSILQLPLQKLAVAKSVSNRAELALGFVSRAAKCFFSQYKECIMTDSATDLIVTLFMMSVSDQCHVGEETMVETREAWCSGIQGVLHTFGDNLPTDSGVLAKISSILQETVTSEKFTSLQQVSTALQCVQTLLDILHTHLQEDSEEASTLYTSFCSQLVEKLEQHVPAKTWEYLCVNGDYPYIPQTEGTDSRFLHTLFTSLYNCKLLQQLHIEVCLGSDKQTENVAMETSLSSKCWTDESLCCLMESIQSMAIWQFETQYSKMLQSTPEIGEASAQLSAVVSNIIQDLDMNHQDKLWQYTFTRMIEAEEYVLCGKVLLPVLNTVRNEDFYLELSPLLDCALPVLLCTAEYLSPSNQVTLTEIIVARLLSLDVDSAKHLDGGVGLLCVLSNLVAMVTVTKEDEMSEVLLGAVDQVISWKEENDELFLYSRDIVEATTDIVLLNSQVGRLLYAVVDRLSGSLTDKHWDFIMCSLVSWIQSIEETQLAKLCDPSIQCYTVSVLDLLVNVAVCLREKVGKVPGNYPENLVTEWTEFFSESIFTVTLPLFLKIHNMYKGKPVAGSDQLLLTSVCNAAAQTTKPQLLEHKLPPLLVAGDLSPLPDNLQCLMNHMCPLLLSNQRCVQMAAFHVLHSIVDSLPQYDKEDKSFDAGAAGGDDKEENVTRSPPARIMKIVDESSTILEVVLSDLPIETSQPISELSEEYHYTLSYLLSWKLLLYFFKSAPPELRQEYAGYLQDHRYIDHLMFNIFRIMPNIPSKMFQHKPDMDVAECGSSTEIQHIGCALYMQILKTMPAMARNWWKSQDRKTSAYVDTFTTKYVSSVLCTSEIRSVQKTDVQLQDMTIKARPITREVIAVYSLEEVSIEMVISLPQNYPLGNISVISEKRVGVSGPQWEKWLLQLNIFLQHQNGNIMDGLRLWKNNIDKRFEGVDECMICFYVLHGTNFQLPRIACRTCKKKFHSSCLYKWFNTSHNCTCPLCRNVF
ncbi:E3 ubiquitin-protein ligase listerin-like [Mercenaria mercenaria]|uniref:E3 ubiquitin-protein ligase listerin-like n=1 Tax=Mercenaria mercenaria TaxID=6596 RepID=UPI00234F8BA1|nr:E3 ubiquitin-protein ligase listerin-like [Mercenaria mercenaria]